MTHRVLVREATPADLSVVVALRLALIAEQSASPLYSALHPDAPARARRLFAAQLASPREATFLAFSGATCLGIVRCVVAPPSPLFAHPPHGYVTSAFVIPQARRRGVLRALMRAAEEWARTRGLGELRLHSSANSSEAASAWNALGFGVVEQLRRRVIPAVPEPPARPPQQTTTRGVARRGATRASARRSTR